MRKLLQEAKNFGTVIGLTALGAAFLLGLSAWEYMKWSDCLASHSAVYCAAALQWGRRDRDGDRRPGGHGGPPHA